jgi:hypothetical protein
MVAEVGFQSPSEIYGESYVVEFTILVERVYTLPMTDVLPEKLLVLFYGVATNPL